MLYSVKETWVNINPFSKLTHVNFSTKWRGGKPFKRETSTPSGWCLERPVVRVQGPAIWENKGAKQREPFAFPYTYWWWKYVLYNNMYSLKAGGRIPFKEKKTEGVYLAKHPRRLSENDCQGRDATWLTVDGSLSSLSFSCLICKTGLTWEYRSCCSSELNKLKGIKVHRVVSGTQ